MARPSSRLSVTALAGRWLARRRFPTLLALAAVLLLVDLVVPDPIPFADELLLAVATALLAAWRRPRDGDPADGPAGDAPR